jgi:dihydrofolate synthase/folylpolyglutamate synthase
VPIGQDKGLAPDTLVAIARRIGIAAQSAAGIEAALAMACALELAPPPRVVITGSLYLAGRGWGRMGRRWGEAEGRKWSGSRC